MTPPQVQEKQQIQIGLEEHVYTRLVHAAKAENLSVEQLVEQTLRERLRAIRRDEMSREMEAYRAQHSQLLEKYPNEYIAMYQGEVVDHDPDLLQIYLRIDERFPDETVLIEQVTLEVDKILNIPSFRIQQP